MDVTSVDIDEELLDVNFQDALKIVGAVPTAAMLVNSSGNILVNNKELCASLGYARGELEHVHISQLIPPEYRHSHQSLIEQFFENPEKRQMGKGRSLFAVCSDGRKIPIEIGLNPLLVDGQFCVLATLTDISNRYDANQLFRKSTDSIPLGILVVDADGVIQQVNKTLINYFGYEESEMLGQRVELLLPERYRGHHHRLRQGFSDAPSMRIMGPGRDLTALHKDGSEFPVEIGLSPYEHADADGWVLVSLIDITERKRMEMDLRDANTNLEEFTYVASHDLRSPLRGISDLLSWIKEDLGDDIPEPVARNIGRVDIRVQRMEHLIESLLTYARSAKVDNEIVTLDVLRLVGDVCEFIGIPEHVTIELSSDVSTIESSRVPIETVIRNVISNAIKHSDKSHPQIELNCTAEGNVCHFSIRDNGPGIPEASLERVFRLFQSASSSGREGAGIGLSICRRMAEVCGGRIRIENNQSQPGVTVHVWWPRFFRKDSYDQ